MTECKRKKKKQNSIEIGVDKMILKCSIEVAFDRTFL